MLLNAARVGDREAFGVLWSRHSAAGRRIARAVSRSDGDDLLSEAYLRIFVAVSNGKGPAGEFRPYLAVTIRNLAVSWARKRREDQLEDGEAEAIPDPRATDASVLAALDAGLTLRAFRTLPERWQEVLWFTEIDGLQPAQVADRMGISANSVAALSYRAREGLRQAWIQAHVDTAVAGSEHQWTLQRVGKHARGALSKRAQERFRAHLAGCAACAVIADEAVDTSSRFTSVLLPVAVGVIAATGVSVSLRASDPASAAPANSEPAPRAVHRVSKRAAVLLTASAVLAIAVTGAAVGFAITDSGGQPETGRVTPSAPPAASASSQPWTAPAPTPSPSTTGRAAGLSQTPAPVAAPRASSTPPSSPTAPAATSTASSPVEPQASPPVVTAVDTGGGVLYPVVHGTAPAGAEVTVVGGGITTTVRTGPDGTWVTGEIAVPAGSVTITASTADGASGQARSSVTAPTVSLSSRASGITVTIHGAPEARYAVLADGRRVTMITADAAGSATTTAPSSADTITVHAADGGRTGPATTITAH
jgi:RNA polymerase sigma factor (sigma-70 family)